MYVVFIDCRALVTKILARIGYEVLGDLYLPTTITTVDQRLGINVRLNSTDPQHAQLPLIDVILSTAAIPVAFPPGKIPALSKYSTFVDGATGVDFVPVIPLLSIPEVKVIYIITFNYALSAGM